MTRWAWLLLAALAACGSRDTLRVGNVASLAPLSVDTTSDAHERGRQIYNFRCYFCHGYSGDARTLASTYLTPPPRDFTRSDARALTEPQLRAAITDGRTGTAMKSFRGILSDADIAAVAAFVRREFIDARAVNTRYHTVENGWSDHDRHRAVGAPKLHEENRDQQKLDEGAELAQTTEPAFLCPSDAREPERKQKNRQAASGGRNFAPNVGPV